MKILIMGLPGSGKTYLAKRLKPLLECAWYNADQVRDMAGDWDFSDDGRKRQSERMNTFAEFEKSHGRFVICDFVCPTKKTREIFNPDVIVWMDTIKEGRFEDTNKMFEQPSKTDIKITNFLSDKEIENLAKEIKNV